MVEWFLRLSIASCSHGSKNGRMDMVLLSMCIIAVVVDVIAVAVAVDAAVVLCS